MALIVTKVLVDVLQNDPPWADWSIAQLRAKAQTALLWRCELSLGRQATN